MIRFVLITIALIFAPNIVSASNDISQFVFKTDPQTIKPNEISGELTIHYGGENADATTTETIDLEFLSDSTSEEFLNKSGNPASEIMNKGTANRTFYYRDSTSGTYAITVKMTGRDSGKHWMASQKITVLSNAEQSSGQSSNSSSQGSSSSSFSSSSSNENIASGSVDYHYKNEQISAKAGEDKTAVAGADIVLEGKAYGFKKEPLENARYLWNLGDWSYKEGKNIRHIYKYPGNYIVTLEVSPGDGDVSASDRMNIKVIPNELQIIDANDEFIKLKNKSDVILDVSGWFLKASGSIFKAPNGSLIRANSELIISSDVSGLKFADKKFLAEILYPNGSVAFSYSPVSSSSSKPKEIILSKPQPIMPAVAVSSSSHTDKITQIIQPPKKPKPTTVVGFGTTTQLASVITIGEKNNSGNKIWLILAVITGIIGGAGIFLARRNNQTHQN